MKNPIRKWWRGMKVASAKRKLIRARRCRAVKRIQEEETKKMHEAFKKSQEAYVLVAQFHNESVYPDRVTIERKGNWRLYSHGDYYYNTGEEVLKKLINENKFLEFTLECGKKVNLNTNRIISYLIVTKEHWESE